MNPGSVVYAYDRASGKLFRATGANFGSWQLAWAPPTSEAKDATVGGMVADPTNANIVWLTTVEKVHRLDCSVNPCTDTSIAAVANPGPVGIRPDGTAVYVATRPTSGGTLANLYRSSNGSSWTPIADGFYQKAAGFPRQISVGADATATVYVATFGDGVVKLTATAG